jgi:hypothetical protein
VRASGPSTVPTSSATSRMSTDVSNGMPTSTRWLTPAGAGSVGELTQTPSSKLYSTCAVDSGLLVPLDPDHRLHRRVEPDGDPVLGDRSPSSPWGWCRSPWTARRVVMTGAPAEDGKDERGAKHDPYCAPPGTRTPPPRYDSSMDPRILRREYEGEGLDPADCDPDPTSQFRSWFDAAVAAEVGAAGCHGARDRRGRMARRTRGSCCLRGIEAAGLVFFTNYDSDKATDLSNEPRAALALHWEPLHRQVRVEGTVAPTSRASRKPTSRVGPGAASSRRGRPRRAGFCPIARRSTHWSPTPTRASRAETSRARAVGRVSGSAPWRGSSGRGGRTAPRSRPVPSGGRALASGAPSALTRYAACPFEELS